MMTRKVTENVIAGVTKNSILILTAKKKLKSTTTKSTINTIFTIKKKISIKNVIMAIKSMICIMDGNIKNIINIMRNTIAVKSANQSFNIEYTI